MSEHQPVDTLLEQGIHAAKAKDYATARPMLERVVELDQHNEKAWFWLAAVTDDIDEKRICLNNVLVINPDNQRAAALLEQLEASTAQAPPPHKPEEPEEDEILPAAPSHRRDRQRPFILLAVFVGLLLVAVLVVLLLSSNDDDSGTGADNTGNGAVDTNATQAPAQRDDDGDDDDDAPAVAGMPTATLMTSPTASSPPPTWTPIPTASSIPDIPVTIFPPPPTRLDGHIILESGNVTGDSENHPIAVMAADGGSLRQLTEDPARGHTPVLSPNGSQFAFVEYLPGQREEILSLNSIQGTDPRNVSSYWQGQDVGPLFEPDTPAWSPDGRWLAFTAVGMGTVLPDLYRVALIESDDALLTLERLTDDEVVESWPSYAPAGDSIVYVADNGQLGDPGSVDLNIYTIDAGLSTPLTTNGEAIIETAPDWSPNGQSIVFQGRTADSQDWDIYRLGLSEENEPEVLIDSDFNDIRPRFSPDGQHIVFSSDRAGNWDVFVYSMADGEMYQLTTDVEDDIANDWSR